MVYGAMQQQPYIWAQEPGERGTEPAVYGYNGVKIPPSVSQRPYTWGAREEQQFQTHTFTSPTSTQQPFLYDHRFTRATDIPGVYTGTPTPLIGFSHLPQQIQEKVREVMPTFDLGSFAWGLLGGAIIMVVVGGVVLYFTWPLIAGALPILGLLRR